MTALPSGQQPCTLMVCTDGSPASQGAVEAGLVLARRWSCRILLLQVLEYNPGYASQAMDGIEEWEREAREGLEACATVPRRRGWRRRSWCAGGSSAPHHPVRSGAAPAPAHHHGKARPLRPGGGSHGGRHRPGHRSQPRKRPHRPPGCPPLLSAPAGGQRRFAVLRPGLAGGPGPGQGLVLLSPGRPCGRESRGLAPGPRNHRGAAARRRIRPASPWTPWYCRVYPTGPSCRRPRPGAPISSFWGATSAPGSRAFSPAASPRRSSARPAVRSWW